LKAAFFSALANYGLAFTVFCLLSLINKTLMTAFLVLKANWRSLRYGFLSRFPY